MRKRAAKTNAVAEWNKVPASIRNSIRGVSEPELDLRGGPEEWSIREHLHHLVEANLIAANMIVAALASDGVDFDWTWVNPNKRWMQRVGYTNTDVKPALNTLGALCRHMSALIGSQPDALARTVKLNDTPGGKRYVMTVEQILRQEVEHARDHLGEVRAIRESHLK
jgi:hypothetical protein